jgi:hypothetical protein
MTMRCCISILIGTLPALLATLSFAGETISEEEAWKLGWPVMQGPYGNFRVPQTGATLVDDLSKARLVWESDTRDFGRAKHTTGSFKGKTPQDRAQKIRDILGPDPKTRPVAGLPRSSPRARYSPPPSSPRASCTTSWFTLPTRKRRGTRPRPRAT